MACKMTYIGLRGHPPRASPGRPAGAGAPQSQGAFQAEREFWLLCGRDLSLHADTQSPHTHTHTAVAVLGERMESPSTPQSLCRMETEAHREPPCPLQSLHIQQGWHTQTSPL